MSESQGLGLGFDPAGMDFEEDVQDTQHDEILSDVAASRTEIRQSRRETRDARRQEWEPTEADQAFDCNPLGHTAYADVWNVLTEKERERLRSAHLPGSTR